MIKTKRTNIDYISIVITILSIIGVIFSIGLYIRDAYLETIAVETKAKILSIDYNNKERYATVTYDVNGANYVLPTPLDESQEELAVNDTLTIKYNINNPGVAIYNEHLKEVLIIIFISLIGTALTTNRTLRIIKNLKYINGLKENGITLEANIVEAYIDINFPKKKSKFPRRIRARYLNPQDNKEYTFDSDYTYKDLNELLSKSNISTIKVYLDKNNTNIYYVDLDNLIKELESTKVDYENSIQPGESKESSEEESE